MKRLLWKIAGLVIGLSLAGAVPAAAQPTTAQSAVTLPVTGTFARHGEFTGTITINRFRFDDLANEIKAVGFVTGVLRRGHRVLGTAVKGEVEWPVHSSSGGVSVASGRAPGLAVPTRITWSPDVRPVSRILRVQAESCRVLNLALGPIDVDLLGLEVALSAVTFDLSGTAGTPLGGLVCAISNFVGTVADLVGLLNNLLGLLTGLLGGLTGGLGGGALAIP